MLLFCNFSAKGDPLWVRTFKVGDGCLLLQLRKTFRGRFIFFSRFASSGKSGVVGKKGRGEESHPLVRGGVLQAKYGSLQLLPFKWFIDKGFKF